jgi:hypothetical protein
MTFGYYTTCNSCGTNEDVEMHNTPEGQKALCPICADLDKYADLATKAAKMQQAEDRLIGVIKGEANTL